MSIKVKVFILALILLIAGGLILRPYFFPKDKGFQATEDPWQVFNAAIEEGNPIFIEFYSDL